VNLPSLASLRSLLPGQAPAPFQASDPASQGGASPWFIGIVVAQCIVITVAWVLAIAGWPHAQWFCERAWQGVAAELGILVPALLAYRSFNKHVAAKVAIAAAQGPAPPVIEVKP